MCRLARYYEANRNSVDEQFVAILKQAARELMLMSASDWQFLISTWSARDYAELRLVEHYSDFKKLADMADRKIDGQSLLPGDLEFLKDCEKRDSLFNEIELEWFARVEYPV
jgi:1,4-alpha-glucan branching enzyme